MGRLHVWELRYQGLEWVCLRASGTSHDELVWWEKGVCNAVDKRRQVGLWEEGAVWCSGSRGHCWVLCSFPQVGSFMVCKACKGQQTGL